MQTSAARPDDVDDCLIGGGSMGARFREFDWSTTPLGPPRSWPQSLKTSVSICLSSQFALLVWWGPELIKLYNDAYVPMLGEKHPHALGQPGHVVWPEIWPTIGPMLQQVLDTGEATWNADLLLLLERHGYPEECYFTFSYSGIRAETGAIGGVFTAVLETTERVLRERRMNTLRELSNLTRVDKDRGAILAAAATALAGNGHDLTFAALYNRPTDAGCATLAAGTGPEGGPGLLPMALDPGQPGAGPWAAAFAQALHSGQPVEVTLPELPPPSAGPWKRASRSALVIAIAQRGSPDTLGCLVCGLNPHRRLDADYLGFCTMAAREIADAIAVADQYAFERRRADALAEIDRAKTVFFTNVSHEFRTPLTLILEPLGQLAAAGLQPAERELVEVAERAAQRLLRLVNTLLTFASTEAGRARARFEPTDLGSFTRDIASAFRSIIETAGLRFDVDCADLTEPVHVDREMWEQMVLNLLSNAVKYTMSGSIAVRLAPVGAGVELGVEDTGVGISARDRPHVFERFYRAAEGHGRSIEGSGIGLSLVRDLVMLHGGQISFDSVEGTGTTFRIVLPLGAGHLPPEQLAPTSDRPARPRAASSFVGEAALWLNPPQGTAAVDPAPPRQVHAEGVATVLVADDNADMRHAFVRALSPRFRVVTAANGREALDKLRLEPADVLVSDVMMPELDGLALLEAVRADVRLRALPVILVSGRAGEEERAASLDACADDYLVKPFRARELVARISQQLHINRLRREAAEREAELSSRQQQILAAEHLRESEERFRRLTELSSDWYWEQDERLRYTYVSAGSVDKLGLASEQIVGRTHADLCDARLREGDAWAAHEAALAARKPFRELLCRRRGRDGATIWFTLSGDPIHDAKSGFRGYRGVGTNVTPRVQAEEALKERESIMRVIFEHAPGGIGLCDRDGRFLRVNQALEKLLGYPALQLQQLTVQDVTAPEDWPENKRLRAELLAGERETFVLVKRVRRSDGTLLWTRNTVASVRDAAGTVRNTIAQLEDFSDQVEAQHLRERLARRQEALAEFSLLALQEDSLQPILDRAVTLAAATLELPWAAVFELHDDGATLALRAGVGWGAEQGGALSRLDARTGWLAHVLRDGVAVGPDAPDMPLTVRDLAAQTRVDAQDPLRRLGVASGIGAPLHGGRRPYGVLAAFAREARTCAPEDVHFLQSLANLLAAAVARAKAFSSLHESRQLLARAQEAAGLGWWEYDVARNHARWSAELARVLGHHGAAEGNSLEQALELVHEADRERLRERIFSAAQTGLSYRTECRFRRPDGSPGVLLVVGQPIGSESGPAGRLVGIAMDVTEQRRSADALQHSADQLRELSRRLVRVQEDERRQLARELHDRVGQSLTALAINLEIARSAVQGPCASSHAAVGLRLLDSMKLVDATSAAIADVMSELRPPMLDDYGLGAALSWYAEQFHQRTGIGVQVRADPLLRKAIQRDRDLALFRIAQEALNNVAKHAGAKSVTVYLQRDARGVAMSVADDGVGFDTRAGSCLPQSLGMRTMRERAAAVGGVLHVESAPAHGTTIVVQVP
jgi:PAS domain S-box-containing protein